MPLNVKDNIEAIIRSVIRTEDSQRELRQVFMHLTEKKFQEAFLYAASKCFVNNPALLQVLSVLLFYKSILGIDINATNSKQKSALYYAFTNKNLLFVHLLVRYEVQKKALRDASFITCQEAMTEAEKKVGDIIKGTYDVQWTKLTNLLGDSAQKNDIGRVVLIVGLIQFLDTHLKPTQRYKIDGADPDELQVQFIRKHQRQKAREVIFLIAKTVADLSGPLRGTYSECLQPSPFTWTTFERLSIFGLKEKQCSYVEVPQFFSGEDEKTGDYAQSFVKRAVHVLHIQEGFIPYIIADLVESKTFFEAILKQITPGVKPSVALPSVHLNRIKVFVDYLNNNLSLRQLLNLCSFRDYGIISKPSLRRHGSAEVFTADYPCGRGPDLKRTVGIHAALRRLQQIGEFNGKKLSTYFYELDPSIDWRALIIIRDAITHQDEGDFQFKINKLLIERPDILELIMSSELPGLLLRIKNLIIKNEKIYGLYHGDPTIYCDRVMQIDLARNMDPEPIQAESVAQRVSTEDQTFFIEALREFYDPTKSSKSSKSSSPNLDELIRLFTEKCKDGLAVFDRTEQGELLRHFAALKKSDNVLVRDKDKYERLRNIVDPKKPTSDIESRESVRDKQEKAAIQRREEREKQFQGLEHIRLVAKALLVAPEKEHCLTPLKRVEAAMEAAKNICTFLFECGYLTSKTAGLTLVYEVDSFNRVFGGEPLLTHLKQDLNLLYAVEYNFGQLLQHLDTIKNFEGITSCSFIIKNYESLRSLRNYIEHGSAFHDHGRFLPVLDFRGDEDRLELINQNMSCIYNIYLELNTLIHELVLKDILESALRPETEQAPVFPLKELSSSPHTLFSEKPKEQRAPEITIPQGLNFVSIPGDGHCLYSAVRLSTGLDVQTLRNMAVKNLSEQDEDYFTNNEITEGKAKYLAKVTTIEWADNISIIALMRSLRRPICVVGRDGTLRNAVDIASTDGLSEEPIFVIFNGRDHYDALIVDGERPACDIFNDLMEPYRALQSSQRSDGSAAEALRP